jgi:hypothetical protein
MHSKAAELRKSGKGAEADALDAKANIRGEQARRQSDLVSAYGMKVNSWALDASEQGMLRKRAIDDAKAHLDVTRVGGEFSGKQRAGTLSGAYKNADSDLTKVQLDADSKAHAKQTAEGVKELVVVFKKFAARGPTMGSAFAGEQPK